MCYYGKLLNLLNVIVREVPASGDKFVVFFLGLLQFIYPADFVVS